MVLNVSCVGEAGWRGESSVGEAGWRENSSVGEGEWAMTNPYYTKIVLLGYVTLAP